MSRHSTMLVWYTIVNLTKLDVADRRLAAHQVGLNVKRGRKPGLHGLDKTGVNGHFRCFGLVEFNRDLKQWGVVTRSDATSAEIATLIEFGLRRLREFGTENVPPISGKTWRHVLGKDGHQYDFTSLARRIGEDGIADVWTSEQLADAVDELLSLAFSETEVNA
jgi:hypothetical protein